MPEYLAPGVYVEEIPSGNMPIQAASTSTAGMVGITDRGPVGTPVLCTSLGDYNRKFGGRLNPLVFTGKDALPYSAEGFFINGGSRLYVVRVVGPEARQARLVLNASTHFSLAADAAVGATDIQLTSVAGLSVGDTIQVGSEKFSIAAIGGNTLTLSAALTAAVSAGDPASFDVTQNVNTQLAADAAIGDTSVTLDDVTGLQVGATLTINGETPQVTAVDSNTSVVTLNTPLAAVAPTGTAANFDGVINTATTVTVNAAIGDTVVTLADVTGLATGDTLTLNGNDYLVASVNGGANQVTLGAALTTAASNGDPVALLNDLLTVHAQWSGAWGNTLQVMTTPSSILETKLAKPASIGDTSVTVNTAFGAFVGSVLKIGGESVEVKAVDTTIGLITLTAALNTAAVANTTVTSQEFRLIVERIENGRVAESEQFDKLSLASGHPRYAADIVGSWDAARERPSESGASGLVRLEVTAESVNRNLPVAPVTEMLAKGEDDAGNVVASHYVGNPSVDPVDRTGIWALENEPSISITAVPGQTDLTVQQALVAHCEKMRYRFAVLDVPLGSRLGEARAHRQNFDSTRCAVYYPGLMIADSFGNPGDRKVIAPSGHMLGIYARTDITRGVHKVPANEVVRGILAFETALTKGEQDILNPINLNCFRDFRSENRGLRIYGGRVATSNPEFRYVSVRRLLLFIEQSLDIGLQWAVFEPNSEPLWDTVSQSIRGFLTTVWRSGALEGTKAEEAFFVRIGYDITMTQTDIDNGKLIAEIGVAAVKPAEFVIVRISQKTREATA